MCSRLESLEQLQRAVGAINLPGVVFEHEPNRAAGSSCLVAALDRDLQRRALAVAADGRMWMISSNGAGHHPTIAVIERRRRESELDLHSPTAATC